MYASVKVYDILNAINYVYDHAVTSCLTFSENEMKWWLLRSEKAILM